ncbi:MAG: tRNA preQ1(34) S-adenosylmethionine ribosyltransferase-isomerase QueA [Spirochaetia bacterium]
MKTSQFSFDLPEEQIAQSPPPDREAARLLVLNRSTGKISHSIVKDLASWIKPGTLIVLNDTRVRKARLFGARRGGGTTEFILLENNGADCWKAIAGRTGRLKQGTVFSFPEDVTGSLEPSDGESRLLRFSPAIDEAWLERNGHVPLPPYIRRADLPADEERYQTVYARSLGSAAAPTAGLHFTLRLLDELRAHGAEVAWVTLHVGLGTFQPIRTENIEEHRMHEEAYAVPAATKALCDAAVAEGRPVLAVGTTVVRTLESAWGDDGLREGEGRTGIYIMPGYKFKVVRQLFTNFHTPGSSLLVLASAFAGSARLRETYARAVRKGYRFFSYGDAMLIQ